jgi:hypothetical protein
MSIRAVRFATDDRVTVTDPKDRHYGEEGHVEDWLYGAARGRLYRVFLDGRNDLYVFTVDQLDFTEEAPSK